MSLTGRQKAATAPAVDSKRPDKKKKEVEVKDMTFIDSTKPGSKKGTVSQRTG